MNEVAFMPQDTGSLTQQHKVGALFIYVMRRKVWGSTAHNERHNGSRDGGCVEPQRDHKRRL